MKKYKHIYGPVPSWRLGRSLGVDIISGRGKVCTFDCVYCQLGRTKHFTQKRQVFVPAAAIIKEINFLPRLDIDYITFSGTGEPALAKNLGEAIKAVRRIRRERIAVLTNASLMCRKDVQRDLSLADIIIAGLDASSQNLLSKINRPAYTLKIKELIRGLKEFKSKFKGILAIQVMFVEENEKYAKDIAKIVKYIKPDLVYINTPLRPSGTKPLPKAKLKEIEKYFNGMRRVNVYDVKKKKASPIDRKATLKRRPR